VEGDALSIAPGNIDAGITNLAFQEADNTSRTLISIGFASVSDVAKVSTVALSEFSSFAPVPGNVSSACQITVAPLSGTTAVTYVADLVLSAGSNYHGNGSDLRVLQWNGTFWNAQPFTFNAAANQVCLTGLTNLSAFVVSQLCPQICIQACSNGCNFQFTPFANVSYTLQRSLDLVTWTPVLTNCSASGQPVTLQDPAPPANQAFYRLLVSP
jgi:hypothetical protein